MAQTLARMPKMATSHTVLAPALCLHLQLLYTYGSPARQNLDCWPAFPIVIGLQKCLTPDEEDNLVAALEHPDRVRYVNLSVSSLQLGKLATVMQEPFPALTTLRLSSEDGSAPVFPGGFLGGSAPCLQMIFLSDIPFPALPTLLSSTVDLSITNFGRYPKLVTFHRRPWLQVWPR